MNITIKSASLTLASAFLLASCAQDDMPDGPKAGSREILFRTSMAGVTTRAMEVTKDNLPRFCVTAFDFDDPALIDTGVMHPLFANETVNVAGAGSVLTSPRCCWPERGKESDEVSFYAFYPGLDELEGAQLANASTGAALDYKLAGFRVAEDLADQVDFIAAYTTGTMADNLFSGITLPFAHQLSRIEIKAHGAHKSCDIEIAGVRIGGAGVGDDFSFRPVAGGGEWSGNPERGIVEYVFREGDVIFKCGKNTPVTADKAVSIMGAKRRDGNDNCAMLIPAKYSAWDWNGDGTNDSKQLYISVLLRVTDATPTAGVNPVNPQRFPYTDLSQGPEALNVAAVYLAVNKSTGAVSQRLYKKPGESGFYSDKGCTDSYTVPASEEVKEFGWAAMPIAVTWLPGNIYTYTLDYTYGIGLLDPEVTTACPKAGDPVISDKVGITYTVKEWLPGGGDEFPVPGS